MQDTQLAALTPSFGRSKTVRSIVRPGSDASAFTCACVRPAQLSVVRPNIYGACAIAVCDATPPSSAVAARMERIMDLIEFICIPSFVLCQAAYSAREEVCFSKGKII